MTPEQTELARQRLWLGITNVGFWVLAALVGIYWELYCATPALGAREFTAVGTAAFSVQALFDFIGGVLLMPGNRPGMADFFRRWSCSVLGHTLVLAGVGLLSYTSFRFTGGFGPAIVVATVGLALCRKGLLRVIGGVSAKAIAYDGRQILTAGTADPAFTGGIVGFGRHAESLLPATWLKSLPHHELAAELRRRQWQIANGLPGRAVILILGWNILGSCAGSLSLDLADRTPAEALFGHACWMTLWAFCGLLALPALSRKAVFAADRASADSGLDPCGWIARFPGLVGEDGSLNTIAHTIFYPIPSAAMRLHQVENSSSGFVPGDLARSNLYYSWATFTLLGRTVHCNVGRPSLWVFPPSQG